MTNQQKLVAAFCDALVLEADKIVDTLSYNTIPEWDSTAHMILIAELEGQFDLMFDTDDIIDMNSVAAAKSILAQYKIEF